MRESILEATNTPKGVLDLNIKLEGLTEPERASVSGVYVIADSGEIILTVREREDGSLYLVIPSAGINLTNSTLNLTLREPMRDRRLPINRKVEGE